MKEKTLIILKPDCMEKALYGKVLDRFANLGAELVDCKMMNLEPALLQEHYAHVAHLPFYPQIESFMQSRPVLAAVLEGEEAIKRVREALGATNPKEAAPDTLRALYADDMTRNICHASDSPQSARAEIDLFFGGA